MRTLFAAAIWFAATGIRAAGVEAIVLVAGDVHSAYDRTAAFVEWPEVKLKAAVIRALQEYQTK